MRRTLALLLVLMGACNEGPALTLDIRLPADKRLLASVTRLDLRAERDGRVLAQSTSSASAGYVSVSGVGRGPRTVLTLDGVTASGDVVGRGRTCLVDYESAGQRVSMYFSPTNFFAPTAGQPVDQREATAVLPLASGDVLLAGGAVGGNAVASSERFSPGPGTFAPESLALTSPRSRAALADVPGIGTIVIGGVTAGGKLSGDADLYQQSTGAFVQVSGDLLGARVGHRAVTLSDGRVLVLAGADASGAPLVSTAIIDVLADGSASIVAGPNLVTARREHAAVVAVGVPVVIGGYGAGGQPLDSIEALVPDGSGASAFQIIAQLAHARAEATATVLDDGSILIVGGADDAQGTPRRDAELYNPITRTTQTLPVQFARRGHTATPLGSGRVLVAGGVGTDGQPLTSVELFSDGHFLSERPLGTPRAGHVAVPLCDGTVLVVGGGPGAEIYNLPAR